VWSLSSFAFLEIFCRYSVIVSSPSASFPAGRKPAVVTLGNKMTNDESSSMEAMQSDDASTGRGASLIASTEIGAPRLFSDQELSLASLR
jgi:hypothetical protein